MAIIYGRPDSELAIINEAPRTVEKFEDIDKEHRKLKDELVREKNVFFEKVPSTISKEEQKLEKMKNDEKITEEKFDEKLRSLEKKKAEGGFTGFSSSLKGYFIKNYSKKREINKIKNLQEKQELHIEEWKQSPVGIFNKQQKETISEIQEFAELKRDPFYTGARGELEVLNKLSQLSDDYHVMCGVNMDLGRYITYNGKKNLRSAQMDFVVVSKRGVILIEVKNWSTNFSRHYQGLSPYQQVERAGRVLWIALKSWRSPRNPSVTSVLLATRGNIQYDSRYKFVNVKDTKNINYFIENRYEQFADNEVDRVVDRIKNHITW